MERLVKFVVSGALWPGLRSISGSSSASHRAVRAPSWASDASCPATVPSSRPSLSSSCRCPSGSSGSSEESSGRGAASTSPTRKRVSSWRPARARKERTVAAEPGLMLLGAMAVCLFLGYAGATKELRAKKA